MKILYIVMTVALTFFYILYSDNLSLIILLSVILLPIMTFLMLIFARKKISIDIIPGKKTAKKNEKSDFFVKITNNGFFPVSQANVTLEMTCFPYEKKEIESFTTPLPSYFTQSATISVSPLLCGKIICNVKEIRLHDVLGLFSVKLKNFKGKRAEIIFLPKGDVPLDSASAISLSLKENVSSETNFNASQTFTDEYDSLRDYCDGDKLNKIAWKLCGKSGNDDNIIVRDFEKGKEERNLLILDASSTDDDTILDELIELFYTAADTMCRHEITFDSILSDGRILEGISLSEKFDSCIIGTFGNSCDISEICKNTLNKKYERLAVVTSDSKSFDYNKMKLSYNARELILIKPSSRQENEI